MIKTAHLSPKQIRLIKYVVRLQIKCLNDMLTNNVEEDITMYCITMEVERERLDHFLMERKKLYMQVYRNPQMIFSLDDDHLTIVKTILVNQVPGRKVRQTKKEIWVKLGVAEKLQTYYSMN